MSFGQITKLTVNIGKCQTHITYADNSTRFQMSNPSGFVFRTMDLTDCRCDADFAGQTVAFLQRHFGRGGSIEKTPLLREMLLAVGLIDYANYTTDYLEDQRRLMEQQQRELAEQKRQKQLEQHTWHTEEMPKPKAQRAIKLERTKGQLQISILAWHLQNCRWRQYDIQFQLPKCHCAKIKETMDYINELVNSAMPMPDSSEQLDQLDQLEQVEQPPTTANSELMPDMNASIASINSLLRELNELLELQNQEQLSSDQ